MTYDQLKSFISNKMSLSHVYQPVAIKTLLSSSGIASLEDIASGVSSRDPSQVEYYVEKVKRYPKDVLTKHEVVEYDKGVFSLKGYDQLSNQQRQELIALCELKLQQFETDRKETLWKNRSTKRRSVPGSIRYEVIKRAKSRCEACGIPMSERALDVDHVVPKTWGGKDDISNYQALCYVCNINKSNKDDTDFRGISNIFADKNNDCLFCDLAQDGGRTIAENTLAFLIEDAYPVTEGHALAIPKRHVDDYFGLVQAEINAINQLLTSYKSDLQKKDTTITGFNIGANCGEDAGQTIFHCHVHLIPRRSGDIGDPTGGVRSVIPEKANYKNK
jgi:diadenosine tetraphosphate (Ap4A) HIT family hydrolase